MQVKFITVKGQGHLAAAPFYVGFVQHDRTMSRRETYEYCAERTGFTAFHSAFPSAFQSIFSFIVLSFQNYSLFTVTYSLRFAPTPPSP